MITRTVAELAELCGASLEGDGARTIVGPAPLAEATASEISFFSSERYADDLERTAAGAVLVRADLEVARADLTLLRCENPSRAFSGVIQAFRPTSRAVAPGVHPTAVLEEEVRLGQDVAVGALCFVGRGTVLGDGATLHPRATVGANCHIGAETELHSGSVLYAGVRTGRRCVVHAGAVLGAEGFGFEPSERGWEKIPQCGVVELGDDVEVGANSAVDRARFGATRLLEGTKVDNLVQVGHNVTVGPHACLVAQVGIAGSSRIGRGAVLAGKAGVGGHLEVGDGARVGGNASVTKSLAGAMDYWGTPARPKAEVMRSMAAVAKLPELRRLVADMNRRLASMEEFHRGEMEAVNDSQSPVSET